MEENDLREVDGHGRLDSTETAKEVHTLDEKMDLLG